MPRQSLTTFMDVPFVPSGESVAADVVIQGAPFDLATTGRPGARFGPDAIRTASRALHWEPRRWPWDFALKERLRVVDVGNVEFPTGQAAEMAAALERQTDRLLGAGHRVLTFGGDHYVTLPLLRAHRRRHGPLPLIHFDAHTDTDVADHDHHGVMFHKAAQDGLLDLEHAIQVGIRTYFDPSTHRLQVIDADWANTRGADAVAQRIRAVIGERPAYFTFDIDGLDPAFAPGTGTPVAGGLSTSFALQTLRGLRGMRLLGADVVEVSPPYDSGGITALAGATLALDLCHLFACA